MKNLAFGLFGLFLLFPFFAFSQSTTTDSKGSRHSIDQDGCWNAPHHCIKATDDISTRGFKVNYKNVCGSRVFLKFCFELKSGRTSCSEKGLSAGKSAFWRVPVTRLPTLRHSFTVAGCTRPDSDKICSKRFKQADPKLRFQKQTKAKREKNWRAFSLYVRLLI